MGSLSTSSKTYLKQTDPNMAHFRRYSPQTYYLMKLQVFQQLILSLGRTRHISFANLIVAPWQKVAIFSQ